MPIRHLEHLNAGLKAQPTALLIFDYIIPTSLVNLLHNRRLQIIKAASIIRNDHDVKVL